MSYFTFLPNTEYRLDSGNTVIAKNILVRAKIMDAMRTLASAAAEYTIVDEERPEHIAYRVYGRADYHWIILMFNEIHDPYFSWPMSINELERHMLKSYPGKSLFINTGGTNELGKSAIMNETVGVPHDRRLPHFEAGSTVEQYDSSGTRIAYGKILSWDPNLWKIEVDVTEGVFQLQGLAARVDANTGQLNPVANPLSLLRDIRCTNSQGNVISASLLRITDQNPYAIHHFENESEIEVSPWYVPEGSASPLIERYVVGRQEVIETAEGTYSIVTNWTNEDRRNESKRNIRVMKPNYIDPLMRELNRLFR